MTMAAKLLSEARTLQAAFPDIEAMQRVEISDLPAGNESLRFLRDEMLLVRAGQAGTLTVLEDEMAAIIASAQ
jgi:hypothetical protein